MLYFILRHLLPPALHWHMIYPSWFVTFIGIGVIPVTSSHFAPGLGLPLFWTSFAIYIIMFPFVLHRIRKFPLPEATKPLLTIVAAPASLCLTGYVSACSKPNMWFVAILLTFAQCLYWGTFAHIQQYTRLSFYPSFAAFTFPLVISATALTRVTTLVTNNALHTFLFALQIVEWIIATFMLIFVTSHYLHFLRHSAVASKRDIAGKS
jgi:exfoliative toxin A/B